MLCAAAAHAGADPMPMSAGLLPGPLGKTEIRIAREDLDIELTRKESIVSAKIDLENPGAGARLQVGFPCEKELDGIASLACQTPIAVTVDGKPLKTRRAGKAWVWPMRFAAGQHVALEVRYRAPLRNERYDDPFSGMGALHYRLVTGAAWAGPIGELHMRVRLPTEAAVWITPSGFTRERGVVSWDLKDVEPSGDLAIFFAPRLVARKAQTPEQRGALAKELRAGLPELTSWASTLHAVTRKELALPAPTEQQVRETVEASAKLLEATP